MGTEEDARKLFVAGLPDTVTDEGLRVLFTNTGSGIDELSLPRDRTTGRPRGFAFVTLSSPEEAERAREQLDGSLMDGRNISVRPFTSGPPRAGGGGGGGPSTERRPPRDDSNRTLYVGNLPYDIEEAELREVFKQLGASGVDRMHLPVDHASGRKRGFAFVSFTSEELAKTGLTALGNLVVRGRPCTVHLAHPRGERPARPERSFAGGGGPGGGGGGGGFRSSPPPAMGRGGPFPPAPDRGPSRTRRAGDDEMASPKAAKGGGRKKRLEEEKRRGGGNARRYLDEVDFDDD